MRTWAAVGSLLLSACSAGSAPDAATALDADAGPDPVFADAQADVEGTEEWTLLIRWARFPELPPSGSREVPGMDLDGHVTASSSDPIGCYFEDWIAPSPYVEGDGVDNQSPSVLSAIRGLNDGVDLNGDILESIRDGGTLLAVRISRIGDPIDDGEVDVAILRVDLVDAPVYETVVIDGQTLELLAPGQTVLVQPDSLIEGRPRTELVNASLRGGRLHTPAGNFSLRVPTGEGSDVVLELEGTRIAGRVDAARLEAGLIAGHVRVEDVPATIASLNVEPPVEPQTVLRIAEQLADIDPDGDGVCEAISIGMQIEGVAANLVYP